VNPYANTPFDVSERTALVVGAGRGLGKEMARILSQAGARVLVCSRTAAQLKQTAQELSTETGGPVDFLTADMSVRSEAARLVREATQRLGGIDILICNPDPETIQR
jgi:3-oxoacyl-[acyl-carrier protein] reductase